MVILVTVKNLTFVFRKTTTKSRTYIYMTAKYLVFEMTSVYPGEGNKMYIYKVLFLDSFDTSKQG